MRLLLIVGLLIASALMGPPAGAQAHDRHAQHQSHAMGGHQHDGVPDRDNDGRNPHAVAHVCPGCALVAQPPLAEVTVDPRTLPRLPANPPSLQAFHSNPIPPPPREA